MSKRYASKDDADIVGKAAERETGGFFFLNEKSHNLKRRRKKKNVYT